MRYALYWLAAFGSCVVIYAKLDSALLNPPAHSQWGYSLADAQTGQTLIQENDRNFLIPASLVKLLTTAFALDKLGAKHRFPTFLYQTGRIENGILRGNLWIRGGGNPALGTEQGDSSQRTEAVFNLFVRALKQAGIKSVEGNVYGDGGLMEAEGPESGALWEDVGNYYGAAPSGLAFRDNSYALILNAAKNGAIIVEGTEPRFVGISSFQIKASDSGPKKGDSCFIHGAFWNTPRLVVGKCPVEFGPLRIRGSLPDPAWTFARNFEEYLRVKGIPVSGSGLRRTNDPLPAAVALPMDAVRLAEHSSPELIKLITVVNAKSDNLYSAQLLILAGIESGAKHNTSGGLSALRAWLTAQDTTRISSEAYLVDGTGLSLQNKMTTAMMTRRLSDFTQKPWFAAWRETLIGGTRHPFRSTVYAEGLHGKLWVKTGSMGGVSALAGYIKAKSGRLIAFTVIVNHFEDPVAGVRDYWGPILRAWQARY